MSLSGLVQNDPPITTGLFLYRGVSGHKVFKIKIFFFFTFKHREWRMAVTREEYKKI